MTRKYLDMNQHDALYKVARNYPGGIEALAQAMGISANVLRNKLAPTIASHYPSFEEVSAVVDLCHRAGVAARQAQGSRVARPGMTRHSRGAYRRRTSGWRRRHRPARCQGRE